MDQTLDLNPTPRRVRDRRASNRRLRHIAEANVKRLTEELAEVRLTFQQFAASTDTYVTAVEELCDQRCFEFELRALIAEQRAADAEAGR